MDQPIEHILSYPIILSDHILRAVTDTKSFNLEFTEITKLVDKLSQMIRSFIRFTNSTSSFYDRPVRRIFADVTATLTRTLNLVRKCRRQNILVLFVYVVTAADFRKLINLLEASIGDMTWLISIFDDVVSSGVVLSLPPIASNDPIIAWVWSYISSLYLYNRLNLKIQIIANEFNSLANDNDRNKTIIVQEGGILALLELMNEYLSPETQISAANILFNLANNQERAWLITMELGVPIIVECFQKSSIRVQIAVAKLIARMAENDVVSQEAFARKNVIRTIVTLLSFEINVGDDFRNQYGKQSICSIVEINKKKSTSFSSSSSKWSLDRKERENEPNELKLELKTCCAKALWMLVRGNLENSKLLTDTKGLLILAKLIETETGELQTNCLMNIMEITALAESNSDLKRAAFKTNSPSSKEVVKQLLKIIQESENPGIKIMAIRSIGSLASTFPARETRVIAPLVDQLSHENPDVGTESAIALTKFTSHDNFLSVEHSKTIIEFDGLVPLMRLLRGNEKTQYYATVLLCYLAMFGGNSVALVHARVLKVLERVQKSNVGQLFKLKELVVEAMYHLNMYHATVVSSHRKTYSPGRI